MSLHVPRHPPLVQHAPRAPVHPPLPISAPLLRASPNAAPHAATAQAPACSAQPCSCCCCVTPRATPTPRTSPPLSCATLAFCSVVTRARSPATRYRPTARTLARKRPAACASAGPLFSPAHSPHRLPGATAYVRVAAALVGALQPFTARPPTPLLRAHAHAHTTPCPPRQCIGACFTDSNTASPRACALCAHYSTPLRALAPFRPLPRCPKAARQLRAPLVRHYALCPHFRLPSRPSRPSRPSPGILCAHWPSQRGCSARAVASTRRRGSLVDPPLHGTYTAFP